MKDQRDSRRAAMLHSGTPSRLSPLVDPKASRELKALIDSLPKLGYPINSAGDLIEKLGGREATLEIFAVPVSPARLVRGMPAHYFPVASRENLIEKLAALLSKNRRQVVLLKELGRLRPSLPKLRFPIRGVDELLAAFESIDSITVTSPRVPAKHATKIGRGQVTRWITQNMKPHVFPIKSEEELYFKALRIVPRTAH